MSDQLEEAPTLSQDEKMSARFDRLESLIVAVQVSVSEIARDQRDMYVDLRNRQELVEEQLRLLRREVEQINRDRQPDSIAARFLR